MQCLSIVTRKRGLSGLKSTEPMACIMALRVPSYPEHRAVALSFYASRELGGSVDDEWSGREVLLK